ncbi:Disease resistance RPP8-like protein 3 [Sesamum angolense]|uniref:Disease resistance RPP8-like protein 3 n=1 Tax=Sesamum angolense TaxID=2727404 RepID=A0AAE1X012_9LAMI|nr:Disease resistance RPP8-like protein 3 [Sesamum angolense]
MLLWFLKHTIERLLSSSQIPSHPPSQELIQVAYNVVKSLQELFTTLEEDRDNEMVKAMNKEIREAACRLEDVLDQAHQPNHLFLSQSETLDGDLVNEVLEEIDFFTGMVKKIRMQLSNYSLPKEDGTDISSRIDQCFGLKEPKIVGFACDLNMLRHYVIEYPYDDPERLIVLAVDGMAGIGKTTLVTGVYLNPFVNRRYLIVVDDLWKTRVWDELKRAFPDDLNKSRVIVTSRLFEVSNHASTDTYPYRMRFLNKEESWYLLRDKVFGGEENSCPPELHKAGREIAVKCHGLPLMIIALAKHLSQAEKTAEYWEKVAEKEYWDIIAADEEMFKVLALSYHNLPQHLKACFLYIASFPLDYEIRASKLTRLWCAEGFLESTTTQKLEHYAAKCLDQLSRENVVQQCESRFSSFAIIKTCKLHPAFLHLCMRENGKDKLFHVVNSSGNEGIESQRRFCIHNNVLFGIKGVRRLMATVSKARSLLCFGPHHPYPVPICLGSFNLLRVLDALTMRFYGFPDEVTILVRLRYLAFTYNGKLHLFHIQIWNLVSISTHSCTTEVLERIPNLVKLGVQIRSAADNDAVEFLSGFDCLTNLDQLDTLKCCVMNPKRRSQNLRALKLRCNAFQGQDWTSYEGNSRNLDICYLKTLILVVLKSHLAMEEVLEVINHSNYSCAINVRSLRQPIRQRAWDGRMTTFPQTMPNDVACNPIGVPL